MNFCVFVPYILIPNFARRELGSKTTHLQGSQSIIIIEGFLLFFFPQVANACHHRVLFQCSNYEVTRQRRLARETSKGKVGAGRRWPDQEAFNDWYRNTVWTNYIKCGNPFSISRFFFRLIAYFFADSFLFSGAILTLLEVAWYSLHNRQAVSAALFTHFFSSDSECGRN